MAMKKTPPSFGDWMSDIRPDMWVRGKRWQRVPSSFVTALMVTAQKDEGFDLKNYGDTVFMTLHDQYEADHPDG